MPSKYPSKSLLTQLVLLHVDQLPVSVVTECKKNTKVIKKYKQLLHSRTGTGQDKVMAMNTFTVKKKKVHCKRQKYTVTIYITKE